MKKITFEVTCKDETTETQAALALVLDSMFNYITKLNCDTKILDVIEEPKVPIIQKANLLPERLDNDNYFYAWKLDIAEFIKNQTGIDYTTIHFAEKDAYSFPKVTKVFDAYRSYRQMHSV